MKEVGAREDEGFEPKCIAFYRKNAIAIEREARDPNGGNVCLFSAATCMTQCKLHSIAAENKHTLLPYGSLDSF